MNNTEDKSICVLGAGNLGISIARGIVRADIASPDALILTRRHLESISNLEKEGFSITSQNKAAVEHSKLIFICVQPSQVSALIDEIKESLHEDQALVSVVTGVDLSGIAELTGQDLPIIRAMPNTAVAVGESMTCISANSKGKKNLQYVESIFKALGDTLIIDESLMQAATVLGASGIAFFMRYLRAATQGGIQMGFHPEEAQKIAVQTAKGAASLIIENESHPEMEIDKVTTPRGCTIEGLNEMEHQGFSSSLIKGLMTSYHKIFQISKQ